MAYSDKYGEFFGRTNECGSVSVFHVDGTVAIRLDAAGVYPIGSDVSVRYEHQAGIVLTSDDALKLGIEIE